MSRAEGMMVELDNPMLDLDSIIDKDGLPITIPRDGAADAGTKAAKADPADKTDKPDKVEKAVDPEIARLRREVEEERRLRNELATQHQAAQRELEARGKRIVETESTVSRREAQVVSSHYDAVHARKDLIDTALAATKRDIEHVKRAMVTAREAADDTRAIELQSALGDLQIDLRDLERGKSIVDGEMAKAENAVRIMREQAAREPVAAPKVETPAPAQPAAAPETPEQYIDRLKPFVGDHGAAWLAEHKQFVTNKRLNDKMLEFASDYVDVHGEAELKNPEFIAALETRFGIKSKRAAAPEVEEPEEEPVAEQPVEPKRTSAAAPVSRSSSAGQASTPKAAIKLSADQANIAPLLYPDAKTPQEARSLYAADLARAVKDNRFASRE